MKLAYSKPILMKRQSLSRVTAAAESPPLNGSSTNGGGGDA
jgi:hypothetical protein